MSKLIIGMVHLKPLPGTPYYEEGSFQRTLDTAVESARALFNGGADGCLVQTVERVYRVDDESDAARTAAMALVVNAIVQAAGPGFQVGVQLMRNALRASLAVATVTGASFIRAGALVGATLTEHGLVTADPIGVIEYRHRVGARGVRVLADVDSSHFTWYGGDKPTSEVARAAVKVGADAVVLGHADERRTTKLIASVRAAVPDVPIILAGHTDHANAARLLAQADGAFVGSCLERGGFGGSVDVELVRQYVEIVRGIK
ncbi:BtpA/SgcQ family protein [Nonomuraea monospora]|uniref:BtpA/SgcQ family protein n=1 Tax=Nonomuraea monospora TaxID=568818 RepID=A0ABN3CB84_9ACTN